MTTISSSSSSSSSKRMNYDINRSSTGSLTNLPQHKDGATSMEKIWAKERYDMNPFDREKTSYELHGVRSRAIDETPELLEHSLKCFDDEILKLPLREKKQHEYCMQMNSTYILSSLFRLRFLRAEFFDAKKAAIRYCRCLDMLVDYFGEYALFRQLFLTDLDKNELRFLKEGDMQLLPARDTLGRRLLVFVGGDSPSKVRDKVGLFLLFQAVAEDVTTQRNGLVSIHLMCEEVKLAMTNNRSPSQHQKFFTDVLAAAPIRWSGMHMCFPDEGVYRFLKPLMLFVVGEAARRVLRVHSGSRTECDYSLSSFGIPLEDIPCTNTGTVKLKNHQRWIKVRLKVEKFIKDQAQDDYFRYYGRCNEIIPFPKIQCPEIDCVLFRKNGVAWEHRGNIKFRAFLQEVDTITALENINQIQQQQQQQLRTLASLNRSMVPNRDTFAEYLVGVALERGFTFLYYEEMHHWYREITETEELRRHFLSALRGHRKRTKARKNRLPPLRCVDCWTFPSNAQESWTNELVANGH